MPQFGVCDSEDNIVQRRNPATVSQTARMMLLPAVQVQNRSGCSARRTSRPPRLVHPPSWNSSQSPNAWVAAAVDATMVASPKNIKAGTGWWPANTSIRRTTAIAMTTLLSVPAVIAHASRAQLLRPWLAQAILAPPVLPRWSAATNAAALCASSASPIRSPLQWGAVSLVQFTASDSLDQYFASRTAETSRPEARRAGRC